MARLIRHDDDWYHARLAEPIGPVRVVIDTDAANEIDDQFALAWALLSPGLEVLGVYAAPFSFAHRRARWPQAAEDAPPFNPPGVGMARSHGEILRVFGWLGLDPADRVFAGSQGYLEGPRQPRPSAAVDHLVATARGLTDGEILYVLALGCVTNISSALLLAPDIAERIVVVWTSGYPSESTLPNTSFNLEQDVAASQRLLDSGVPLVYLPGYHVGAQLRLSRAEADRHLQGHGPVGDALHACFVDNPLWALYPPPGDQPYSWVIWDLICVAWVLEPRRWVPSRIVRTPHLEDSLRWRAGAGCHPMREAWGVDRDAIFNDLFAKVAGHAGETRGGAASDGP